MPYHKPQMKAKKREFVSTLLLNQSLYAFFFSASTNSFGGA